MDKKKIGIVTLYGNNNFGNKLQNYALQEKLRSLEFNVETLNTTRFYNKSKIFGKKFAFLRNVKNKILNLVSFFNLKENDRKKIFCDFSKQFIIFNKKNINHSLSDNYNFICFGSDQIWNPATSVSFDIALSLFSNKEKNFSYAASFGVYELPKEVIEIYKNGMNNIKKISVREDKGKDIIKEITGREDVEVLVDPTMLLSTYDWNKISKKPKQIEKMKKKKYILNYFLGNLSKSRRMEIERIAKENNCEIINILDKNDPFYVSGPSEFLYLEKNAFLICTDSFHSCVFALLYNKAFIIFDREGSTNRMNSRIDTLISKFKLTNRKYNGKNITKENLEHDYTEAYKILEEERKKSDRFLKKALDIE